MNIREIFLELTTETYPHGYESELVKFLPQAAVRDEIGNYFLEIGDNNTHAFTSHMDTFGKNKVKINHKIEGNIVRTDGKSILGADDKAGMSIMLWLIDQGFPGIYYFFVGEEIGCLGSKHMSKKHGYNPLPHLCKIISLDRRGNSSFITHQSRERTSSDSFANSFCRELSKSGLTYFLDNNGFSTDSFQFSRIYSECCNLSVGYGNEHTTSEFQDLQHLEKLSLALTQIDFNKLQKERDPKIYDYLSYNSGRYNYSYSPPAIPPKNELTENKWVWDKQFNQYAITTKNLYSGKIQSLQICKERLDLEKDLIKKFLEKIELDYITMDWDGLNLLVKSHDEISEKIDRDELSEFIPELDFY